MRLKNILKRNRYINRLYIEYKWRECRVSYGDENRDKTFYVIRRTPCCVGLFSYVCTVMGHIKYAIERSYIPIVDMQNYENTYLEQDQVGKVNAWEFYFEQPMGYSLEDIQNSKNVILSWGEVTKEFPAYPMAESEENYQMWHDYASIYLNLSTEAKVQTEAKYQKLLEGKRVVGVLCRGTDYSNFHPAGHPVQPGLDELMAAVERIMRDRECEYVYLATEDEEIYEAFRARFCEKLIVNDVDRYKNTGNSNINEMRGHREHEQYLKGMEYLTTILLLSRCNCLVSGCSGGVYGAMLLTSGYEEKKILYKGCYPS